MLAFSSWAQNYEFPLHINRWRPFLCGSWSMVWNHFDTITDVNYKSVKRKIWRYELFIFLLQSKGGGGGLILKWRTARGFTLTLSGAFQNNKHVEAKYGLSADRIYIVRLIFRKTVPLWRWIVKIKKIKKFLVNCLGLKQATHRIKHHNILVTQTL